MRRLAFTILLLLSALAALAADTEIVAILWITNTPAGLTTNLTVDIGTATTRNWTNNAAGSTSIQVTNSTQASRTNLLSHLTAFPVYSAGPGTPQLSVGYNSTNTSALTLTAPLNTNLTVNFGGNWASLTYITNTYGPGVPILSRTNSMSAPARTNAMNAIVNLLSQPGASNALPTNLEAFVNYLDLSRAQTAAGKIFTAPVINGGRITTVTNITGTNVALTNVTLVFVTVTAGNLSGFITALTNGVLYSNALFWARLTNTFGLHGTVYSLTDGYYTNAILDRATLSNGVNYGNAFRSPGAGPGSEQFGSGAQAAAGYALAIGNGAYAGTNSVTAGYLAGASHYSVSIGSGSDLSIATNSVGIGQNVNFGAVSNATGIGRGVTIGNNHHRSWAYGADATTTTNDQGMLGSSYHTVVVPGLLTVSGSQSNTTFRGTNVWRGDLNWPRFDLNTLAAGNNISVPAGTNVFIRCNAVGGAATICGIIAGAGSGGRDGQPLFWFNDTGFNLTFAVNTVDPVAANRINTPTSTDLVLQDQGWLSMFYDGTDSRWKITGTFPTTISATNLSLASGSLATNTASFTITTNDFVINTYYTNVAQRSHVSATLTLGATITDAAQVSLFVDQDADGSWERTGFTAKVGGAIAVTDIMQLGAWLQPGARFLFTNQSAGAATATITANSSQWVKQ